MKTKKILSEFLLKFEIDLKQTILFKFLTFINILLLPKHSKYKTKYFLKIIILLLFFNFTTKHSNANI